MIRTLRGLVTIILASEVLTELAVILAAANDAGQGMRLAGLGSLLLFVGVTFVGTVPINNAVLDWIPKATPAN